MSGFLVAFDTATGKIGVFTGGEDLEKIAAPYMADGWGVTECGSEVNGWTHYILNGEPTERPTQSTTLDARTLTGLPIPATLHIDGETYEVDDGTAELDFILPGTYRLRVVAWPYRDWEEKLVMA
jgi:hypothetical protein